MLFLYSFLLYILTPFIPVYLLKRSIKNRKYRLFWAERFGLNYTKNTQKPIIWIHSVSVGETRAIAKIVAILTEKYPEYKLLITVTTPTGRDTAIKLYPQAIIRYVPYDFPYAVNKFYRTFSPKIGLIVETEIWPNLIFYAKQYKMPLFLINARLSDKSYESYNKFKFFIGKIINSFDGIICQNNFSRENFLKLGYSKHLEALGNIKFDITYDKNSIANLSYLKANIRDKKVVVFFSTRVGEEEQIINNLPRNINYLIIIIPRHPERFKLVEEILLSNKIKFQKRSQNLPIQQDTLVLLGDSMGEMMQYYHMSNIAVVGGSFSDNGGQNLIEPIMLNKPVIFGTSMFNFIEISENALQYKCALQVSNLKECFFNIEQLFDDEIVYNSMVENCSKFINSYTGASIKTVAVLEKFL
jgi:3-deoxy-D-manno-octulosonic-acid transferase